MELKVIQKLRELSDKELADIFIKLMLANEQVLTAFIDATLPPETVSFTMYNNGSSVPFTMLKTQLDQLIKHAQNYGNNKVGFIKEVRQLTGASLLEAKLFADSPIHDYVNVGWNRM